MSNYFDNTVAEELFLNYRDNGCLKSRDELIVMSQNIIIAIINTHRFHRFGLVDDLVQQANSTILKKLDEYDPNFITVRGSKVLIFNYISLLAKNSIFYYTKKQQKHRTEIGYEIIENTSYEQDFDSKDYIEDLVQECTKLATNSKIVNIFKILGIYLRNTDEFDKKEFAGYCSSYGYSAVNVRCAIKIMEEIYSNRKHI